MAKYCLPFLYVNMGGEMVYVLEERLIAQDIPKDRACSGDFLKR